VRDQRALERHDRAALVQCLRNLSGETHEPSPYSGKGVRPSLQRRGVLTA
jgi:hypothetical protein